MTVEIISVGTEILLGNIVNTNANYLAKKCAEIGLNHYYQVAVGDNEERLSETLKTALSRSDIIILTGGLGPTKDDLTKEVTAKVTGRKLVEDLPTRHYIKELLEKRLPNKISENNWKQALVIEGCQIIKNDNGTAPGLIVKTGDEKHIILLPGPPKELIPMFEKDINPYLRGLTPGILHSVMVKICGVGESMAETMIEDLIEGQNNPTIAPYAKPGEVHFRITAKADTLEKGEEILAPVVEELKNRFGNYVYSIKEEENLEDVIVAKLLEHNLTLTTAESCTGGMAAARLVNVSGVSGCFKEGFITYSNEAKIDKLSVSPETLEAFGAVSPETAKEMAAGAMKNTNSQASIAITGIAGPDGGTIDKPVGLVYIGIGLQDEIKVYPCNFYGNREKVRENAVVYALNQLRLNLLTYYN